MHVAQSDLMGLLLIVGPLPYKYDKMNLTVLVLCLFETQWPGIV